jgi:hypothetical protein
MAKINKRVVHTYLSCFFAPVLLFFIVTGTLQMLELHEKQKGSSYEPPKIIKQIALAHRHQYVEKPTDPAKSPVLFRYFVFAMSAGFAVTMLLGVQIALENRARSRAAILCLILGTLAPAAMLILNRF